MSTKRFNSNIIYDDNNSRAVRIYVDPLMKHVCEIPIPALISDHEAIDFAKKTYIQYAPHTDVVFA